jgi:hypothetical protein
MKAKELIEQHRPYISDGDEKRIIDLSGETWNFDAGDLAIRTCKCGLPLDGFDEYVPHIQKVLEDAGL